MALDTNVRVVTSSCLNFFPFRNKCPSSQNDTKKGAGLSSFFPLWVCLLLKKTALRGFTSTSSAAPTPVVQILEITQGDNGMSANGYQTLHSNYMDKSHRHNAARTKVVATCLIFINFASKEGWDWFSSKSNVYKNKNMKLFKRCRSKAGCVFIFSDVNAFKKCLLLWASVFRRIRIFKSLPCGFIPLELIKTTVPLLYLM